MSDNRSATDDRTRFGSPPVRPLLQTAIDQFHEDCRQYNEAVGSYNTHLDNHRDRCDLHDIPFRDPITAHAAFDGTTNGDRAAMIALLTHVLDQTHLDSQLRRHSGTYPVHTEAVEHLRIARERLVSTLEEMIQHVDTEGGDWTVGRT